MTNAIEILSNIGIIINEFVANGFHCYLWGKEGHTFLLQDLLKHTDTCKRIKVIDETNIATENFKHPSVIIENITKMPSFVRLRLGNLVCFDPYIFIRPSEDFSLYKKSIFSNHSTNNILKEYLFDANPYDTLKGIPSRAWLAIPKFGRSKKYIRIAACGSHFAQHMICNFILLAKTICENRDDVVFDWYGRLTDSPEEYKKDIEEIKLLEQTGIKNRIRFWEEVQRVWSLAEDANILILFGDIPFCREVIMGAIEKKIPLLWLTYRFVSEKIDIVEQNNILALPFNTETADISHFIAFLLESKNQMPLKEAYHQYCKLKINFKN